MGQRRKRDENQHPKKEEAVAAEGEEGPEFEDAYADDYESEGEVIVHDEDGEGEQMEEAVDEDEVEEKKKVWFPGQDIAEDEELDFENDAYEMLHRLNVDWPCLSFDYLRDTLGVNRVKFPLTFYFVAGTMAERNKDNKVQLVKVSNLCRTRYDDDEFAEVDEEEEGDPVMESKEVPHNGIVNRIRVSRLVFESQRMNLMLLRRECSRCLSTPISLPHGVPWAKYTCITSTTPSKF
uniref:Histone-binding protein RBBP4-like N-terminal domain-containing protein n=1 Tax=Palpitomonas bilix TaxID=652834 RepID=A0A7S3GL21_9EUKA|mmetsp:Transcript_7942/g.20717  ORF Transcript_7942/g.20717 Transcript_7942/m.20717 type:complete len:236 (+) Transcript_7942:174-881(+)